MRLNKAGRPKRVRLKPTANPVMSFQECADDLGVHLATWRRYALPYLEIVEISAKRRGVTLESHQRFKEARTPKPQAA